MVGIIKRALGLKLNADSIRDLRAAGVPAEVVGRLAPLEGEFFSSSHALLARASTCIGPTDAARHAPAIIENARMLRPRRLGRLIRSVWTTYFPRSRLLPSWGNYLLLRPVPFTARLWLRWWWFAARNAIRGADPVAHFQNSNAEGFVHNRKQVLSWLEGHRNRTESIMNVLRTIQGYDPYSARVLVVGPRNEGEILLLCSYGFNPRNISSIDLFSYSPRISVMDMNDLDFPDHYFDIYYSSAVIKYSPDITRSVSEAVRVTRDGGLMAFGFMFGTPSELIPEGSELAGGLNDLYALFAGNLSHIYWQEELEVAPGDTRASTIFRLRK